MSELISFVVGMFLPALVELVKTKFADKKIVSYSIALVSCALVGGITTLLTGGFNAETLETFVGSLGTALIASQSVYNFYWKPAKIDEKIQKFISNI